MVKAKMSYFWPKKGLVGPNLQKKKNSDKYSAFKRYLLCGGSLKLRLSMKYFF